MICGRRMGDSGMADEQRCLRLSRRLDLTAAAGLRADLLARAGDDLSLDAEDVAHLGGLCLQVLLAAGAHWRLQGRCLSLGRRSPAFDAALDSFAIPRSALEHRGVA